MERVSSILTSFPPDAGSNTGDKELDIAIRNYIKSVNGLGSDFKETVLSKPNQVLQLLDPSANSIGSLAVVEILISALDPASSASAAIERSVVLDAIVNFILKFDSLQVRYVGSSLLALLERIGMATLFSPLVSIELLAAAILRIDPTGSMFTSTHLVLANLAYSTALTGPAMPVIEHDLIHYPGTPHSRAAGPLCNASLPPAAYISTATGLTRDVKSTSVLEYNLATGLIYMLRRDWDNARKAFERVVTHPNKGKGVSKLMTEAYKKWLLVGLLGNGQEPTLPPHTSHSVKTVCASLAAPYASIASLFGTPNAPELRAEVESNSAVWEEDGNGLLIREVLAAYQKWQIINLRRVYSKIPLSRIQALTSSAETGETLKNEEDVISLIQAMITSHMLRGELHISENGDEGFLEFQEDQTLSTEENFAREIAQSLHDVTRLAQDYKLVSDRLSGNKEYVKHVIRELKRGDKEAENPSGNFETQIEDEDLMTGIIAHG